MRCDPFEFTRVGAEEFNVTIEIAFNPKTGKTSTLKINHMLSFEEHGETKSFSIIINKKQFEKGNKIRTPSE